MQVTDLQAVLQDYLEAFTARDLARCLDFYADDANLTFQSSLYKGKKAIEEWHTARFEANLQLTRLDEMVVQGETVTADMIIASNRLKAWKIKSLPGTATFQFEDGKIKDAKFGARLGGR